MTISGGTYAFGADTGRLWLLTTREGLASAAGHDLLIAVTEWSGVAEIDGADPERSRVRATIQASSFDVREGTGGVKPLTDKDRREIKSTLETKILAVSRYPTITFIATAVSVQGTAVHLRGDLTIRDATRPIDVAAQLTGDDRTRFVGSATVVQTQWNVTPYKGLLGALKVADPVTVRFDFGFA